MLNFTQGDGNVSVHTSPGTHSQDICISLNRSERRKMNPLINHENIPDTFKLMIYVIQHEKQLN